jgi:hypothetical protein
MTKVPHTALYGGYVECASEGLTPYGKPTRTIHRIWYEKQMKYVCRRINAEWQSTANCTIAKRDAPEAGQNTGKQTGIIRIIIRIV